MSEVVSFETAKRLEAAGFPQPAPQVGQMWYTRHLGALCLVIHANETESGWLVVGSVESGKISSFTSDLLALCLVYAPSATDILNYMRGNYRLSCSNYGWWCYRVEELPDGTDGFRVAECYNDKNPADAAAAAWLSIYEKTATQWN